MAREQYEHIFIKPTKKRSYTKPPQNIPPSELPERDRNSHSDFLKRQLELAWAEQERRNAVFCSNRNGAYIEFIGEPGYELVVKSLEAINSENRVLNVRKEGEGESEKTMATVYIPNQQKSKFFKKIRDYATEIDKRNNKWKNLKLINSISDIRLAIFESFWRKEERLLIPKEIPDWVEVWLSSDKEQIIRSFEILLDEKGIEFSSGFLMFPERTVRLIRANRNQLEQLIEFSDNIAEFRYAKEVSTKFIDLDNIQQLEYVNKILKLSNYKEDTNISVCLLDTGVNNDHLLLKPLLEDGDLYTVKSEWGVNDHKDHGTKMAGLAAYGDILETLSNEIPVEIFHKLESVKILPPPPEENPKYLWGDITSQGVSRAEIKNPERKRIICCAITAPDDCDRGRPSSWSASMDKIASGADDDIKRMIVLSAGNVFGSENWRNYPDANCTSEIEDPGQSWNSLTVGAYTEKVIIKDKKLEGYIPIAPSGGLSPFSSTSLQWPENKWPIKPEVLFEGGNAVIDQAESCFQHSDLLLLSTYYDPQTAHFVDFAETSAASAQCAWTAAQIQAKYPNMWPETLRGLIVHSASWTETMKEQFLESNSKRAYSNLLKICGYGVPDLEKALYCASNTLTLISQAMLQPFDKKEGRLVTRDMHLYQLPWPTDALMGLGETRVTMRVTLSYFIEPSPGEIGWENRYRYASHGLRFDLNGPTESRAEFEKRINNQARDEGGHQKTESPSDKWIIGSTARNVGSVHSDIWEGSATDLATSNLIAVYPIIGWWRERHRLNKWNRECRYSLIVSIYSPEEKVDIYTPVLTQIELPIPIEISTNNE